MKKHAIQLNNLSLQLGNEKLFEHFSWTSPLNKFSAWIGPSGRGKTSLAKAIAGQIKLPDGEVLVRGQQVQGPGRRVVLVSNRDSQWDWMTVQETLDFVSALPQALKDISGLIEDFGLSPLLHRYPNELSEGQRQRLLMLRGLISKPEVLILDETLNSLDWDIRQRVIDAIIRTALAHSIYLVLITHHPDELPEAYFERYIFKI